ncbi:MAG: hypothetical protein WB699_19475 [Bacteroidota bacterium]
MNRAVGSVLILLVLFGLGGCNEELGPLNEPSGFSGVIRFRHWPPVESIREMRLVAFESVPTDSGGIIPMLIAGKAAAYPPIGQDYLPTLVDSVHYEFTTAIGTNLQIKNYEYVAVMYQYGPNILSDWRPAGVFSSGPPASQPAAVRVILHHVIPNIDIQVDFDSLPPIPWRP